MKFSILDYVLFAVIIVLFLVITAFWIYWKLFRRRYTRERFAFFGTGAILTTISVCLPYAFGYNTLVQVANVITENFFNYRIEGGNPGFSDKILALLIIAGVMAYVSYIFRIWNGDTSLREHKLNKEPTSLLREMAAVFKQRGELDLYEPELHDKFDFEFQRASLNSLPWHQQVAELLNLYSHQYKIDGEGDWYRDEKTLISSFGNDFSLAVFCPYESPEETEIRRFLSFAKSNTPKPNKKFVIVHEKGDTPIREVLQLGEDEILVYNEAFLLENLIDFSSYFRYLVELFEQHPIIEGYPYKLEDTYTKPTCNIRQRGVKEEEFWKPIKDIEQHVSDWLDNAKDNRQLAILGEYGQGKSVLSQRIAYLIAKKEIPTKRIPIIVELRGRFPKQNKNMLALLSEWSANFGINPKSLLKLHQAGRLLIIFEGFDEMELVGDYAIRVEHFRRLWEFSIPKSKLIITGRPNFFLNDNELRVLLRTATENKNLPYCEEIYLKKFDHGQIGLALRAVDEGTRKDILQLIQGQNKNSSFFDLISRPSSLFLASVVWKERNLSKYKEDINSAIIIDEFLKHSYSRQAKKGSYTPISIEERAFFMQGIAIEMVIRSGYTNSISQNELQKIVSKLYAKFPHEVTQNQVIDSPHTKPIQSRFEERYNEESIFLDVRSCGILVRDLGTFDSFKFAHKSFLELLVSKFLVSEIVKPEDEKLVEQVVKNTYLNLFDTKKLRKSPDVIRFMAQVLASKLEVPKELNDKGKIKFLFKKIYKSRLGKSLASLKIITLFGQRTEKGLAILAVFIFYFILASYAASNLNMTFKNYYWFFALGFGLIFAIYFLVIGRLKNLNRTYKLAKIMEHTDFNPAMHPFLFRSPIRIMFPDTIDPISGNDRRNLVIWFLLCKDYGLGDSLKKIIPRTIYYELELASAYLNRDYRKLEEMEEAFEGKTLAVLRKHFF